MSGFDIRDLRKNQADKYAKIKEHEDNEKKHQEELKRLETEQKMLQEIQYKNDFEDCINQLDIILFSINGCSNILEMNMYVESFKQQIDQNNKFLETEYCREEIVQKITELINTVSQNQNAKFDFTVKDSNSEAAQKITDTIKQIMNLCKLNENDVNIELMDTTNDENIAKKLEQEDNYNDMEFHKFIPIHQRLMDDDIPDLIDDNDFVPINTPVIPNPLPFEMPIPTPVITNSDYYVGFDAIEDPELVQLAYFQNELLDN